MQTVKSNINNDGKGLPYTEEEAPSQPPSKGGVKYAAASKHIKNSKNRNAITESSYDFRKTIIFLGMIAAKTSS